MTGLFESLQRRNVFRVAATYVVVGWVLLQITDVAVPALLLPEWVNSLIFLLLAIGFPIAVIMAWAFEVTPEGIKKASELEETEILAPPRRKISDYIILSSVLLIVAFMSYQLLSGDPGPTEGGPGGLSDNTVAVLPFQDLSSGGGQEFYVQAISGEVRSQLARISGVRVASQTSVAHFKGGGASLKEVGEALDVAAVLEGSVQKVGSRTRINVQLVSVEDGFPIWSETYDHDESDPLTVQAEVARAILEATKPLLLGGARATDGGADDLALGVESAFLAGQTRLHARTPQAIDEALEKFKTAISLDPGFAKAYAGIAQAYLLKAGSWESSGDIALQDAIEMARPYLERALSLNPDLDTAHAAKGLLEFRAGNTSLAFDELERAIELNPNSANAHLWLYLCYLSEGRIGEGIPHIQRANEISPDSLAVALNFTRVLSQQNRMAEADAVISKLTRKHPGSEAVMLAKAALLVDQRKVAEAIQLLHGTLGDAPDNKRVKFYLGSSYLDIGAASEAQPLLEDRLGWFYLAQGNREGAVAAARRAFMEQPGEIENLFALADAESAAGNHNAVVRLLEPFYPEGETDRGPLFHRSPLMLPAVTLAASLRALGDSGRAGTLLRASSRYLSRQRSLGVDYAHLDYLSARVNALMGHDAEALKDLTRAVSRGLPSVSVVSWDPALSSVRGAPQYKMILAKLESDQSKQRKKLSEMGILGRR